MIQKALHKVIAPPEESFSTAIDLDETRIARAGVTA